MAAVLGFDAVVSPVVRAIEARALVERLLPTIHRADLPAPDTTKLGEAFALAFDAWREALAAAVRPQVGRRPRPASSRRPCSTRS